MINVDCGDYGDGGVYDDDDDDDDEDDDDDDDDDDDCDCGVGDDVIVDVNGDFSWYLVRILKKER